MGLWLDRRLWLEWGLDWGLRLEWGLDWGLDWGLRLEVIEMWLAERLDRMRRRWDRLLSGRGREWGWSHLDSRHGREFVVIDRDRRARSSGSNLHVEVSAFPNYCPSQAAERADGPLPGAPVERSVRVLVTGRHEVDVGTIGDGLRTGSFSELP